MLTHAPPKGYMRDDETPLQDEMTNSNDEVKKENEKKKKPKLFGIFIFNDDGEN